MACMVRVALWISVNLTDNKQTGLLSKPLLYPWNNDMEFYSMLWPFIIVYEDAYTKVGHSFISAYKNAIQGIQKAA